MKESDLEPAKWVYKNQEVWVRMKVLGKGMMLVRSIVDQAFGDAAYCSVAKDRNSETVSELFGIEDIMVEKNKNV